MEKTEFYGLIIAAVLFLAILSIGVIQFTVLFYRQRNLRKKDEEKFQQELLRTQLEIQEQTLKNISVEIHDNIGQTLSLVKLNLALIDPAAPVMLEKKLGDSYTLITKAIQDLRDLSKSLNTDYVSERGLLNSIGYELDMIGRTGAMQTELIVTGQPVKLDSQKELILFRIVQESLNNAIKHAAASFITVEAGFTTGQFRLLIRDNGKGFEQDTEEKRAGFGLGLKSLRNRAALINASCEVSSVLLKGTEVLILLPFS